MGQSKRKYYLLVFMLCCFASVIIHGQSDTVNYSNLAGPNLKVDVKEFKDGSIGDYRNSSEFEYSSKANYDESIWQRIKRWFWAKYDQLLGREASTVERIISWAVVLASLLLLVYFLTKTSSNSIFSPNARRQKLHATILDEKIDISNMFKLIQSAEANKDFRLAIRYRFIEALLDSEKLKLITLEKYKTIADYVAEFNLEKIKLSFTEISRIFEFVWYGEYQISEAKYDEYTTKFNSFSEKIKK